MSSSVIYLLNIDSYAPEVTALTYPLIHAWARKIGAEVQMITERRFPGWPVVYEKLQIHRLAQENKADWHIYLDSDALVHPNTPDWTQFLSRDTVAHNGVDHAAIRWRYDEYFLRDGRNVGSCNWNTIASSWCLDLWRPLDDLTCAEAVARITPTHDERRSGVIDAAHLIDDYALSRNIARFGLKVQTLIALEKRLGLDGQGGPGFYHHCYTKSTADKASEYRQVLRDWGIW
jgi:hypothetical protein